jgi:Ca2+-binding RTX toxin-like protein
MSTLTYSAGRPQYDWEIKLQNILATGTFSPLNAAGGTLTLTAGADVFTITGAGLLASGARTVTAGTITGFSISSGGQNILTMTGLTLPTFTNLQNMVSGAAGLAPYSEAFKTLFTPFFMNEAVNATGSGDGDSIFGSSGVDTINAGGGDDYVRAGGGVDNLDGGGGSDFLDFSGVLRTVGINLDLANNTVTDNNVGAAVVDNISGFESAGGTSFDDIMRGDDGNTALFAQDGNDTLYGGQGDNYYQAGKGNDTVYGGLLQGNGQWDKISYEDETGALGIIVTSLGGGNVTIKDTFGNTDTGFGIDEVKGSKNADTFNGSADDEQAEGMGGNDTFYGGGGRDRVQYIHEVDAGTTQGIIVNLSTATITATLANGLETVTAGHARDSFGNTDTLVSIEDITGTDYNDYIVGNSDDNNLEGYQGADKLYGGAGNDNLRGDDGGGVAGNDQLYGGDGDDSFKGGAGADLVDGGAGRDRMEYNLETTFTGDDATHGVIVNLSNAALVGVSVAGIASTTVAAGTAVDSRNYIDTLISIEDVQGTGYADILVGDVGEQSLEGNQGADIIRGGLDGDWIVGGAGNDTLDGGTGGNDFDTLGYATEYVWDGGTQGVTVNLSGVTQGGLLTGRAIDAFGNTDTISNFEMVVGTGFVDTVYAANLGGGGYDFEFKGFSGNDVFVGTAVGRDRLDYNDDERFVFDVLDGRGETLVAHGITVNFASDVTAGNGSTGTVNDSFGFTDTVSGVDAVRGTSFVDTFNGGADDEQFQGLKGADILNGGAGFDVAAYNSDRFGNGVQAGGMAGIIVNFSGDLSANNISVGTVVDGFGTTDQLTNIEAIDGTDFNDTMTGGADRVEFWANNGDDTFNGGSANDYADGGSGNDNLRGGAGGDDLHGGDNDDNLNGGVGGDQLDGSSGFDYARYDDAGAAVTASLAASASNLGEALGDTYNSIEGLVGSNFADKLTGDGQANSIWGAGGADTLYGLGGSDYLNGGDGIDIFYGGTGADTMVGGTGNDLYEVDNVGDVVFELAGAANGTADNVYAYVDFTLGTGVDNLIMLYGNQRYGTGNATDNIIYGNSQLNILQGGAGYDTLIGGAGSDYFIVNAGFGVDVISDFTAGAGSQDAIVFSKSLFTTFAGVLSHAAQVGADTWIGDGFGNTVVLSNVMKTNLHADDFQFA